MAEHISWLADQITLIKSSLITVDKLFEVNTPDADAKAHHIMNVAIPGIRKRLNEVVVGPGKDTMNQTLDDLLVNSMKDMASKHGMNMAMSIKSDDATSTNPEDWKL